MNSGFDKRCNRLRKQFKNASRDLERRDGDEAFVKRSVKKARDSFQAELDKLSTDADSAEQVCRIEGLTKLLGEYDENCIIASI